MSWKIIEIEQSDKLSLFLNNLIIWKEDTKITIPINDIDVLLINNYRINISVQLINELTENLTLVILCNNQYLPQSIILPIIGNYNTIKVIDSQLSWTPILKAKIWKEIIKIKIKNQSCFLKNILQRFDISNLLMDLSSNLKDYDITNREGHASKIYWHTLFGIDWKRHEDDYWNKLLNYGYTILRGYMTRSIVKKGLDPRISIFHKSYHNYFALASDLMEPFRVLIDYEVYHIYKSNSGHKFYDHKTKLIECFNNKVMINGKRHYVNNAIDIFVDAIVNQESLPDVNLIYD